MLAHEPKLKDYFTMKFGEKHARKTNSSQNTYLRKQMFAKCNLNIQYLFDICENYKQIIVVIKNTHKQNISNISVRES